MATRSPQRQAHYEVATAIRKGLLERPNKYPCADCNGKAIEYDHRDYSKPLVVEPVCRRCNLARGTALNKYPVAPSLTATQLQALGAQAFDRGESIYEAEIRSGLTSDELLHFEAGYFARQAQCEGQGVSDLDPSGDFEIRVLHGSHFSAN